VSIQKRLGRRLRPVRRGVCDSSVPASSVIGDGTVPPDREATVLLVVATCPEFAVEIVEA
jgi:hypothetical protein